MADIETYDSECTDQRGGLIRFDGDNDVNMAALTVADGATGNQATVWVNHWSAVALLADLGGFVART